MTRDLDLGFIALTDAAPLIVARERGFFDAERLHVTLRREVSWATIRDKVSTGLYQGAHMLAPMLLAANAGAGSEPAVLIAPLALNAHGAAVGISSALSAEMTAQGEVPPFGASALARASVARRARGKPAISFAVVFAFSMHNYMLRHWLAAAGVDPDRDVRIVAAPPTAIAARLRSGEIDGFCVSAPWGGVCEVESGAQIVLEAGAFWPGGPDKVLGVSSAWAQRAPDAAAALTRAVLRAAAWADAPEHAGELARLLARADLVGAPEPIIARKLGASDETNIRFARAARPNPAHARWILTQMLRWGQIDRATDLAPALIAYRPDLYEAAAAAIGLESAAGQSADAPPGDEAARGSDVNAESLRLDAARYTINRAGF